MDRVEKFTPGNREGGGKVELIRGSSVVVAVTLLPFPVFLLVGRSALIQVLMRPVGVMFPLPVIILLIVYGRVLRLAAGCEHRGGQQSRQQAWSEPLQAKPHLRLPQMRMIHAHS